MNRSGVLWSVGVLVVSVLTACGPTASTLDVREQAHRLNNRGVALLEQLNYAEAERAFRDALASDHSLAQARVNLSLALLYQQQLDAAAGEAAHAARLWPAALQPLYIQGLVARAQGRNDIARSRFSEVHLKDGSDTGTGVQLAQIALEERRYDEAIERLRPVVAAEPHHVTAAYVLGLALVRSGQAEGQQWLDRSQALREAGTGVTFGTGYLEQGRYGEAMSATGTEMALVDTTPARAAFSVTRLGELRPQPVPPSPFGLRHQPSSLGAEGAASLAAGLGGGVTLLDADADGDLDVVGVSAGVQQLWRNDSAAWIDITAAAGLQTVPAGSVAVGALAADYDNDGRPDLLVLRFGTSSLYHNEGGGRFRDVTREARLPPYPFLPGAAAFADLDHDGDLDLVVVGLADIAATSRVSGPARLFPQEFVAAPWQVLRNNGNGSFTDVSRDTGFARAGHAVAVVPADFDNRRDSDLLVVYADAAPALLANQRDGTFHDIAQLTGLGAVSGAAAVTAADVNHDDWPDLFFGGPGGGVFALSDGQGRFTMTRGPAGAGALDATQSIDYDGDGLLDLVGWTGGTPSVWRHVGPDWRDETARALPPIDLRVARRLESPRGVAVADLDGDGDTDMVSQGSGALWLWRNTGDPRHASVRVTLQGRASNRTGVGAKVQIRAGSLWSRRDLSAATPAVGASDLVFGLGARRNADAVRVLWPSGIVQAELPTFEPGATLSSAVRVEELDRKPSSCPLLFTWNGERFEFVTDFLGGGEMGAWIGPRAYAPPDPVELVRISGEQLRPRNGRLELRITNELEEVLFLDRVQLLAVDHANDVTVFPDEGMTIPPKPDRLLAVRRLRPPAAVHDERGHDMMARLAGIDRVYADGFALAPIRGYAAPHALTIDLGADGADVLLLTGWTDYAFSSDNVAARQAGMRQQPPIIEVKTPAGRWRALDVLVGMPVGRPQTVPIVLTGQLRAGERELRLTTNLRIYWDRAVVGELVAGRPPASRPVVLRSASLAERGFSAVVRPDGRGPEGYDYSRVSSDSPWKAFPGWYTPTGDVRALVENGDDRLVVARSGDEVALVFDAPEALDRASGLTRTWILRAEGYSKEMDINSAGPDAVGPLPFRHMSGYPYPSSEQRPPDPDASRRSRRVVRMLPPLSGGAR